MTHGSLFSGIGGFDLAAQWMGWENKFHCEWNEFGQKVLHHYWPQAKLYGDITKSDFNEWKGRIDVLSGGFPCQPYSAAGKRLGKEDDRHLWPQMLRAIREISPRWVVGENVRGLTNWNGGLVFDEVQADLEATGYEVTPFLLPACAVNAPHRRDRIWFVAYANNVRSREQNQPAQQQGGAETGTTSPKLNEGAIAYAGSNGHKSGGLGENRSAQAEGAGIEEQRQRIRADAGGIGEPDDVANASGERLQGSQQRGASDQREGGQQALGSVTQFYQGNDWRNFPTQSPVCSRNDGVPSGLVGITVPKHRNESIKGYGNAVVPQVVYQIFKAIQQYES